MTTRDWRHEDGNDHREVGDDDASAGYIRIKQRQAREFGFAAPHVHLPATATQSELHDVIATLNADRAVHALLVQHPVPAHLDYDQALAAVHPDKDVDGTHPLNIGRLAALTPAGVEALLAHHDIPVAGREVVILGRGAALGRPLAILLGQKRPPADAAVTERHGGRRDHAPGRWGRPDHRCHAVPERDRGGGARGFRRSGDELTFRHGIILQRNILARLGR